jgi:hypothetical protein
MRSTIIVALAVVLSGGAPSATGQTRAPSADAFATPKYDGYKPSRNGFSQPDLSGMWSNATATPFERPAEFKDRLALTDAEVARIETGAMRRVTDQPTDPKSGPPPVGANGNVGVSYNRYWVDSGTQVMRVRGQPRSSMITTTADGRVPTRKTGAPAVPPRGAVADLGEGGPAGAADNPEARSLTERCIFLQSVTGPVLRPAPYNNNYQIIQGRDAVAIDVEMIHDTRIVRLNAKHRIDGARPYMGDSIGWYEGDSLVVETTSFHPAQTFYNASDQLKVTERFTRVADNRLLYQFTVEDPKVWDKPWGGEYEFWASAGVYEYACHEGNYGLHGILSGARAADSKADVKKAISASQ